MSKTFLTCALFSFLCLMGSGFVTAAHAGEGHVSIGKGIQCIKSGGVVTSKCGKNRP